MTHLEPAEELAGTTWKLDAHYVDRWQETCTRQALCPTLKVMRENWQREKAEKRRLDPPQNALAGQTLSAPAIAQPTQGVLFTMPSSASQMPEPMEEVATSGCEQVPCPPEAAAADVSTTLALSHTTHPAGTPQPAARDEHMQGASSAPWQGAPGGISGIKEAYKRFIDSWRGPLNAAKADHADAAAKATQARARMADLEKSEREARARADELYKEADMLEARVRELKQKAGEKLDEARESHGKLELEQGWARAEEEARKKLESLEEEFDGMVAKIHKDVYSPD
eukprot:jgi/Mesvir1/588/Mv02030-RA.1